MIRGPEMGFVPSRMSGFAIASLVLSFFGIAAIPGLICGIIALRQIRRSGSQLMGRGVAIAGIVVSCVSVFLVASLVPVFMAAREAAHSRACVENLKQISTATLMYTEDWDDNLPRSSNWVSATNSYIKNVRVYHCATDTSGYPTLSYAYNEQLSGLRTKLVREPGNVIMQFDASSGWGAARDTSPIDFRHGGGDHATIAFADGHVLSMREWTVKVNLASHYMFFNPRASAPERIIESGGQQAPPSDYTDRG